MAERSWRLGVRLASVVIRSVPPGEKDDSSIAEDTEQLKSTHLDGLPENATNFHPCGGAGVFVAEAVSRSRSAKATAEATFSSKLGR